MLVFLIFSIVFLIFLIFLFPSVMFLTINLILLVCIMLFILNLSGLVGGLTSIIIAVVYIGAIIILFGYICAICPNVLFSTPAYIELFYSIMLFIVILFSLFTFNHLNMNFVSSSEPLTRFFYSLDGCLVLYFLASILFLCLLIVTRQYLFPKGPFRSSLVQK